MTKNPNNTAAKFAELVRNYQGLVYTIIYGITLDGCESYDLAQEVFIKAFNCEKMHDSGFNQKAWLVTVARNEALKSRRSISSRLRYLARFCGFASTIEATEMENRLIREENIAALRDLLSRLDEQERQIITLRFEAEMSYQQIADEMQIKIGTVMSRLARLKERLGVDLQEDKAL